MKKLFLLCWRRLTKKALKRRTFIRNSVMAITNDKQLEVVNYFHFVLLEAGALVGSTTKVTFRLAERHLHIR
jgi:hypothetical protein